MEKDIFSAEKKRIFFFSGVLIFFFLFLARGVYADTTAYVLNTNTHKFHEPSCSSVSQMKPQNRQDTDMSYEEILSLGYSPCKNCNPRPAAGTQRSVSSAPASNGSVTFVLNTNTRKFHRPDCSSVAEMKEKNRAETTKTYTELVDEGYEPCKKCNPF